MEPTSSPTSSERSLWSRSPGALAAWLGVSTLLVLVAFAASRPAARTTRASAVLPLRLRDRRRGRVRDPLLRSPGSIAAVGFGNAREAIGFRRFRAALHLDRAGRHARRRSSSRPRSSRSSTQARSRDSPRTSGSTAAGRRSSSTRRSSCSSRPFVEEVFYRGLGVRVLGFLGPLVAIGGTALVFALAHGTPRRRSRARDLRRRARLAALAKRERVARGDRPWGVQPRRRPRGGAPHARLAVRVSDSRFLCTQCRRARRCGRTRRPRPCGRRRRGDAHARRFARHRAVQQPGHVHGRALARAGRRPRRHLLDGERRARRLHRRRRRTERTPSRSPSGAEGSTRRSPSSRRPRAPFRRPSGSRSFRS